MKLNIPVGISNFQKVRESGYYYVDKSLLISRLVQEEPAEVTLITRPRRFGKTMGMSMLASFFDIHKDSRTLFDDLRIAGNESLCREWMNQWPVIFFTLKDIDGLCFEDAYEQLKIQIADLYKEYAYLIECERIDDDDRQIFLDLKAGRAGKAQVGRALSTLMRMLQAFYGKTVILLLDEYDVPLAKASQHGLQVLDIPLNLTESMEKDAVISLFMIQKADGQRFLRQNILKMQSRWRRTVVARLIRSIDECIQMIWKTSMIRFIAMGLPFTRNDVM